LSKGQAVAQAKAFGPVPEAGLPAAIRTLPMDDAAALDNTIQRARFARKLAERPANGGQRERCVEMIPVRSRAMRAVGYDPDTLQMRILFKQGHAYDFCGVPAHVYRGLMDAPSKGGYYNDHIKDRYPC
jgi:hypothetical protein